MNRVVFITGGARSGKSNHALALADDARHKAFIATAEPFDHEMQDRIEQHQQQRGNNFKTIEEPIDIAGAFSALDEQTDLVVVDCLTVWLGNLMHRYNAESKTSPKIAAFLQALKTPPCDIVVVSNELGMGIVPENDMARLFRDLSGTVNQQVAAIADEVIFMVSGIPLTVKKDDKE